ncbi:Transcription factor [Rhodotorula toruloides ATCC 204091]|uniref:Transcription factor n=1 Tax=Rhodotorula toruloides TaxID=5286 RepID=A0A0K3CEA0_RHOTO|nr:Transcription factor [Rhodotorula toruloides ATCC 204091]KAK4334324.1 Transcription factor MBP1 [Rhodotorula toruloides]PRQ75055.1 transcription factor [Rhodotorula toruloides]
MATIYRATYSGVPVYEMPCHGVAVMRRKSDAWLNATQILKVAGFDKPQRTRVLEREVQKGTHEKVQGGYGKYQGTWVPMERGIALSRQYGVDRLLQPIFDFVPTAESPPLAPKHITAAPSRPRKKQDVALDLEGMPTPPPVHSRASLGKAAQRRAAALADEDDDEYMGGGRVMTPAGDEASEMSQTPSPLGADDGDAYLDGSHAGPSKKRKMAHDPEPLSAHAQLQGLGPLRYARMILDYFVSESTQVPQFLLQPPADFDPNVVIDDDGHTALHWACAMGRIRIVKLLLSAGADIFRANSMGQTALMRSVMFTNNYDLRKFPELFELLHRSTINIDRNDRTVFHYIVDIALQKGKTHAARYYMETVLQRLADYPEEVADILNFQDEEGETALTLAARARSKRLVKILLDNGADPKIANRDGKTAEDYILEDERFREQDVGVAGAAAASVNGYATAASLNGAGGAAHISLPMRTHSSETGQQIATKVIPDISNLLDTLATSFDAELADKERELTQADATIAALQSEIAETQQTVQQLEQRAAQHPSLVADEEQLQVELAAKMGKRFRLGWEKWVRDEDQREQQYEQGGASDGPQADLDAYRDLVEHPPADAVERANALRGRIEEFRHERKRLFDELVKGQAAAGTTTKLVQYRQLVALGCGVPLDQVDAAIDSLTENLDHARQAEAFVAA